MYCLSCMDSQQNSCRAERACVAGEHSSILGQGSPVHIASICCHHLVILYSSALHLHANQPCASCVRSAWALGSVDCGAVDTQHALIISDPAGSALQTQSTAIANSDKCICSGADRPLFSQFKWLPAMKKLKTIYFLLHALRGGWACSQHAQELVSSACRRSKPAYRLHLMGYVQARDLVRLQALAMIIFWSKATQVESPGPEPPLLCHCQRVVSACSNSDEDCPPLAGCRHRSRGWLQIGAPAVVP